MKEFGSPISHMHDEWSKAKNVERIIFIDSLLYTLEENQNFPIFWFKEMFRFM